MDIRKLTSDLPCLCSLPLPPLFIATGEPLALMDSPPLYCVGGTCGGGGGPDNEYTPPDPSCGGGGSICCTGVSFRCGVPIDAVLGGKANPCGGPDGGGGGGP